MDSSTSPSESLVNFDLRETEERYFAALAPLVRIADAFDDNNLDNEARKFWGSDNEHECTTPHNQIELYNGRGGRPLLTLADCMRARELVRGIKTEERPRPATVLARRGRIRLLTRHGDLGPGSVAEYAGGVLHGGHTDSEKQYILNDGTHVASQNATELT